MKKINYGFIIFLTIISTRIFSQGYKADPAIKASAQQIFSNKVYLINVFVDKTSTKNFEDVQEIIVYVNNIYFQAKINFQIYAITIEMPNFNNIQSLSNSIKALNNEIADISIYITGSHSGDVIGVGNVNTISTYRSVILVDLNIQKSNKACSGIIVHELGHIFGLKHCNNSDYIMSLGGNQDYCEKFTTEDYNRLLKY